MINNIRKSAIAILFATSVACNVDKAGLEFEGDILQMPATVKFDHGVYNIATDEPYDTVLLKVHTLNVNGEDLDLPIRYEVKNPTAMSIDSAGVLHAKSAASSALIFAYVTVNEVTRKDSAYVNIVAGTPVDFPKRIALQVPAGDSAKYGYTSTLARGKTIQIIREGINTPNLSTLGVALRSSNSNIATILQVSSNASVRYVKPGKVYLHINTYAYGTGYRDSLEYTLGWPVSGYASIYDRIPLNGTTILDFHPKRLTVGIGACVTWSKGGDRNLWVDILFDDPDNVSTPAGNPHCYVLATHDQNPGDIPLFTLTDTTGDANETISQNLRSRVFTKAGSFKYRTSLYGTTGEIYVCDEQNDTTCTLRHQ